MDLICISDDPRHDVTLICLSVAVGVFATMFVRNCYGVVRARRGNVRRARARYTLNDDDDEEALGVEVVFDSASEGGARVARRSSRVSTSEVEAPPEAATELQSMAPTPAPDV